MTFTDDIIYTVVLTSSIAAGLYIRSVSKPLVKQLLSSLLGLSIVIALCGWEALHSGVATLGTLILIWSHHRRTPLLAFIFVFSYLLFFRCSTFFGLPQPTAVANAVQLLLTLKLISVAIEIHDFRLLKRNDSEPQARFQLSLREEPSAFDIVCYSYCYVGLFTGPFFKYRTYQDFLDQSRKQCSLIPWQDETIYRVKHAAVFGVLYLAASQMFWVDYVKTDQFYDRSFLFRLLYMVPIFFLGRMRFYLAWLLAECSFITAAFGAYPKESKPRPGHGPTEDPEKHWDKEEKLAYSFETIRNINPGGSEWSKTVRDGMRNWNMSVQWWLANYVHKRWPASYKQFRIAAVLACSAYWHGISPGYFGAFLSMPFFMMAEDLLIATIKQRLPQHLQSGYDWLNWFFKMRSFEYMYMAFALLTWEDTYRWWKSIYFIGHVGCGFLILACMLARNFLPKRDRKTEKGD